MSFFFTSSYRFVPVLPQVSRHPIFILTEGQIIYYFALLHDIGMLNPNRSLRLPCNF